MKKETIFETVHENAAGIDIGAEKIFVSVDGIEVVSFDTFTSDYYKCAEIPATKQHPECSNGSYRSLLDAIVCDA